MKSEFGRKAEAVFGEKGPVMDAITGHFGDGGSAIREHHDPDRAGSPLHSLRSHLDRTVAGIRDALKTVEAVKEAASNGSQKGESEERCESSHWVEVRVARGFKRASPKSGASRAWKSPQGRTRARSERRQHGRKGGKSGKGDFVATLGGSARGCL